MKMSRMFENGEKDDKPEDEIREKQESKVSKIRNSLEEMMSNTKVRKKKYEVKRRTKRAVSVSESEKPQRVIFERWATTGGTGRTVTESKDEVMSKMSETNEVEIDSKATNQKIPQILIRENIKQKIISSRQIEASEKVPLSRHRKEKVIEENLLGQPKKSGQKVNKIVQKENIIQEKVKIWDHHFNTEQAVMKIGGTNFNLKRPVSNEKTPKNYTEHEPSQTTKSKKKVPEILRGANSLGEKRAEKERGQESTFLYSFQTK